MAIEIGTHPETPLIVMLHSRESGHPPRVTAIKVTVAAGQEVPR